MYYESSLRGADTTTIQSLPLTIHTGPNVSHAAGVDDAPDNPDNMCIVCRDEFEVGDALRVLPCFHKFHVRCIDPWLCLNKQCPVCHTNVYEAESDA